MAQSLLGKLTDFKEVVIFRGGGGPGRSDFLKAVLTEAGIASVVRSESAVAGHPFTVGPMSEFQILVSAEDADRAQDALAAITEEVTQHDGEEEDETGPGLFSRAHRKKSSRDRAMLFLLALASIFSGIALLVFSGVPANPFGILLILMSAGFFAASRGSSS